MKLLTTIEDIRKYRQLGKQLNADNFEGRVREVQENELTELLGRELSYELFDYLDNNWIVQAGTFVRNSDTQFTALAMDLTSFVGYGLRINEETFVIIKAASLVLTDTIIEVEGYILPALITTLEYKIAVDYLNLLNGKNYLLNSKMVSFNGLRPFISWKLLAIFVGDGSIKHSDTGNMSILSPNFERPSGASINAARSVYLENSSREENRIVDYLNENQILFPLWVQKGQQNIESFNFIVV